MKFIDVLHGAAELCGLTPAQTFSNEDAAELARHITRAVAQIKRAFPWPCLEETEERAYRPDYDSGTMYAAGEEVFDPGTRRYFYSLQNWNGGNALPAEGATSVWWEARSVSQFVDMRAEGETPMEAIYSVHDADPRGLRCPPRRDFLISGRLAAVGGDAPVTVWVVFRRALEKLTTEAWVEGTTYVRGDLVYVEDDGDCYVVVVDGVDGDYPPLSTSDTSDTPTWARVEIPEEWQTFLELRAAAFYLIGDGEREAAGQLEADALQEMNTALADIVQHQGQTISAGTVSGAHRGI